MRRLQLVELEDLPWIPRLVRDGGTDVLDYAFKRFGFYDGVMPRILSFLNELDARRIVDLCSGGGGAALHWREQLRAKGRTVDMTLTDLYPNDTGRARVEALRDAQTRYLSSPTDAMSGAAGLDGVRTMSGALHHFPPDAVGRLLAGIVAQQAPIAFVDVAASPLVRRLPIVVMPVALTANALILFLATLLLVPLVRPVRASRLILTYLVPAIPILFAWDGTVSGPSCLHTRGPAGDRARRAGW